MENAISLRFPQKLWKIVNESKTEAIQWNNKGTSVILNYKKFQREYLDGTSPTHLFKTTNLTSFIRQLNLYGFRKISAYSRSDSLSDKENDPNTHEFYNIYFVKGRFDLLSLISRKTTDNGSKVRKACMVKKNPQATASKKYENHIAIYKKALTKALVNAINQHDLKENKLNVTQDIYMHGDVTETPSILQNKECPDSNNGDILGTWDYATLFEDTDVSTLITSTPLRSTSPITNTLRVTPDVYLPERELSTLLQSSCINSQSGTGSSTPKVQNQWSWNEIIQQADNVSEKICTVLLTNEDQENVTPRVITEPIEMPSSLSQSQLCYSIPISGTFYELNWN